jgi:hypothetical protein
MNKPIVTINKPPLIDPARTPLLVGCPELLRELVGKEAVVAWLSIRVGGVSLPWRLWFDILAGTETVGREAVVARLWNKGEKIDAWVGILIDVVMLVEEEVMISKCELEVKLVGLSFERFLRTESAFSNNRTSD